MFLQKNNCVKSSVKSAKKDEIRQIDFRRFVLVSNYFGLFWQEKPKAELIAEFGKPCSEELMAHLDGFFNELANNPASHGSIIFYGDQLEGRNLNFIRYLMEFYPAMRRVDKSKLSLLRGQNQSRMKIQLWVVPAWADVPQVENTFVQTEIAATTLFDKNWADFNRWRGGLEIYSNDFYDLGCEFSPNTTVFAKILLSNPKLTGYLIVYTKPENNHKRGNQIAAFALRDLTRNYKVPQNQLKAIYGGNRTEPEIELWLVPSGQTLPKSSLKKTS